MGDEAQTGKGGVASQLAEAMSEQKISKNRMAAMMGTSRTQVDRLLNATDDITLGSLQRAAAMVGRRVRIELVVGAASEERNGGDSAADPVAEDFGWLG
jgi:transcriptional regulator with XRE-family HTH domain